MVNIQGGFAILDNYGRYDIRFGKDCVYTEMLAKDVSTDDLQKLLEFGWTSIGDYMGFRVNYSPEFETYFSASPWPEFINVTFGEHNEQTKVLCWDTWQSAKQPPSLPAYQVSAKHWS